jgi:uncharacterized protein
MTCAIGEWLPSPPRFHQMNSGAVFASNFMAIRRRKCLAERKAKTKIRMILETIITTQSRDRVVHIAPMGIREEQGLVVLAPFKPSATLENVLATGVAVQNFCDDVRVFAGCVSKLRRDWPTLGATQIACARLADTLAHSELKLERVEDDELRPRLLCRRVHDEQHGAFKGFNRAQAAVIEAAILVSRLALLPREKIDAEVSYLKIAIEKTAGPREQEAWSWLMRKIDAHRAGARVTGAR